MKLSELVTMSFLSCNFRRAKVAQRSPPKKVERARSLNIKIKVFLPSRYFVATVTCYIQKNIFNTIIFPSTVAQW